MTVLRKDPEMADNDSRTWGRRSGGGDAVYGLGFIGALVYYLGAADGLWAGVLGVGKALVWPAFMAYDLFRSLH